MTSTLLHIILAPRAGPDCEERCVKRAGILATQLQGRSREFISASSPVNHRAHTVSLLNFLRPSLRFPKYTFRLTHSVTRSEALIRGSRPFYVQPEYHHGSNFMPRDDVKYQQGKDRPGLRSVGFAWHERRASHPTHLSRLIIASKPTATFTRRHRLAAHTPPLFLPREASCMLFPCPIPRVSHGAQ